MSSLVMCTPGTVYVQDVPKVILALGLGVGAAVAGGGPSSPLAAAAFLVALACAATLMWAAGVLANVKAITQVQFNGMFATMAGHDLARVPTPLYGSALRVVLTTVVPIAFLTTVPAQVFFGAASPIWALGSVALTAAVVILTGGCGRVSCATTAAP